MLSLAIALVIVLFVIVHYNNIYCSQYFCLAIANFVDVTRLSVFSCLNTLRCVSIIPLLFVLCQIINIDADSIFITAILIFIVVLIILT